MPTPYDPEYYNKRKIEHAKRQKDYTTKRNIKIIEHYSKGTMKCICCGEDELDFLSIDHIENDGNKHRKKMGKNYNLYQEIHKTLPEGYQVLCMNCNHSKGRNRGKCIHTINNKGYIPNK